MPGPAGDHRDLPALRIAWLGRVPYVEATALQERLRAAILDEGADEALLLLEHDPVVTLGRRADPSHVLVDEATLRTRGIDLVRASRGGDVTWHGPGQLVAYPIVRLDRGVVAHVEAMAAAVIEVLAARGLTSTFHRDRPGVWLGDEKLCAFGVHVHRRVTTHGLALNVSLDPRDFDVIVPCGLADAGVTSLARAAGAPCSVEQLAPELGLALARHLARAPRRLAPDEVRALREPPLPMQPLRAP